MSEQSRAKCAHVKCRACLECSRRATATATATAAAGNSVVAVANDDDGEAALEQLPLEDNDETKQRPCAVEEA